MELNKKMCEFAGLKFQLAGAGNKISSLYGYIVEDGTAICVYPDGTWDEERDAPDFPNDIKACFDYIVPKLNELDDGWILEYTPWFEETNRYGIEIFRGKQTIEVQAETPALAFCKAVEKLIDGEAQNDSDGEKE